MRTEDTLPDGWTMTTSGELFTYITSGSRGWAKYYATEGAKFIRVGNLSHFTTHLDLDDIQHVQPPDGPEARRTLTQAGDLLVSITADVGMVGLVPDGLGEAYVNQHVAIARPTPGIDNRYLAWFLSSEHGGRRQFKALQRGATKAGLGLNDLKAVEVPVPPRQEQGRIVEKVEELLSDLDAGVSGLARARVNLKRYRAAVLKAAVTGELTAEWRAANPNVEPATKLLDRILAERRRKWEVEQEAKFATKGKTLPKGWQAKYIELDPPDSAGLRGLPDGWCWVRVNQVGEVQLGRQRSPQHHYGPHMRPYLRVANVFENRIDTTDVLQMNFTPVEYETYRLQFGDILLNEGQSLHLVGRPAMYRDEVPGACFQNTLVRFRAGSGLLPEFALYVFLAFLHGKRFQKIARWTVNIAHLGADRFSNIEFPLPPLGEQQAIVAEVEEQLSEIDATENYIAASLKRAGRLRQSILKEAFSGRLVPQDPTNEPAAVLLNRIRQTQSSAASVNAKARGRNHKPRQPDLFE
jgi:type I restriction enzyme S subunit